MWEPRKIKLLFSDPCPCGSGRRIDACHLDFDGQFRKPRPDLEPPGNRTGFSHAGCYLRQTHNCSEDISREHYISRSVLSQLNSVLDISGMPWMQEGKAQKFLYKISLRRFWCSRHNSALAPLDEEAALFFGKLIEILTNLERKSLARRPKLYLIGGDALELWMLKLACGVYHAIGSHEGNLTQSNLHNGHGSRWSSVFRC